MKDVLLKVAERTGLVNPETLGECFAQSDPAMRLDDVLLSCPSLTEDVVLKLFAAALGWDYLPEVPDRAVPPEFIESVPATYAQHHFLIGIKTEALSGDVDESDHHPNGDGELTVVLSKPLDVTALDNVSKMTGLSVRPAVATRAAITSVIDTAYEQRSSVIEEVAEELDSQNLDQLVDSVGASDDLLDVVNRPPVIRLVNDILFRALQLRASDIHIEPYQDSFKVRYRVDGILYDLLTPPKWIQASLISRIKVMAKMNIAETRAPQDGRISLTLAGRPIDRRSLWRTGAEREDRSRQGLRSQPAALRLLRRL